jgi:hypothetical protein
MQWNVKVPLKYAQQHKVLTFNVNQNQKVTTNNKTVFAHFVQNKPKD